MEFCPDCGTQVTPGSVCGCNSERQTPQNIEQRAPTPPQTSQQQQTPKPPEPSAVTQPITPANTNPMQYPQVRNTAGQPMPGRPMPGQPMPGQPMPGQPIPSRPMPGRPMPTVYPQQGGATYAMPGQPMPYTMPMQPVPGQPMPPVYPQPAPMPYAMPPIYPRAVAPLPPIQNPYGAYYQQPQLMLLAGKTMIKVSSILLIVFGGLLFFGMIGALTSYVSNRLEAIYTFELSMGVLTLSFGIVGTVVASKKERASMIIGFGIALVALYAVDFIWGIGFLGSYYFDGPSIVFSIAGLVLSILLIVGGNTRRNASF